MSGLTTIPPQELARRLGRALQRHRKANGYSSRLAAAKGGMSGSMFREREAGHYDMRLSTFVQHCRTIQASPVAVLAEVLAACGWKMGACVGGEVRLR